jgi:hypothetical protein
LEQIFSLINDTKEDSRSYLWKHSIARSTSTVKRA